MSALEFPANFPTDERFVVEALAALDLPSHIDQLSSHQLRQVLDRAEKLKRAAAATFRDAGRHR